MLAKLRKLWDEAPVVTALDGAQIRLPGFAVPLETDGEIATRFLLVPYVGACIHVPPPPLNQTVLVEAPKGARIRHVFDPVWVTGRLTAVSYTHLDVYKRQVYPNTHGTPEDAHHGLCRHFESPYKN